MMLTLGETVAETRKKIRKKTKASIIIPKLASKTDLERKDQQVNMTDPIKYVKPGVVSYGPWIILKAYIKIQNQDS